VHNDDKAPAGERSRYPRLRDRIETTSQKEKDNSGSRRNRSGDDRPLFNGIGRGVWRLRQKKKKEKKIKGIKERRGDR